jgi:hypothetical protein
VKLLLTALGLALILTAIAQADPSTSPEYTAADQAQFAKLGTANGKWTCADTPPSKKPDVITAKQLGNWYVWTESGDAPNTTFARWNATLRGYTEVEIDADGSTEVYTTKSTDPFNATWKPGFPPGAKLYPYSVTTTGNTFKATGKYKDAKTGKVLTFKSICTKS